MSMHPVSGSPTDDSISRAKVHPGILTTADLILLVKAYSQIRSMSQKCDHYWDIERNQGISTSKKVQDHQEIKDVLRDILGPRKSDALTREAMGHAIACYIDCTKKVGIVLNQDSGWRVAGMSPEDPTAFNLEFQEIIGYLLPDVVDQAELTAILEATFIAPKLSNTSTLPQREIDLVVLRRGSTPVVLVFKSFLERLLENKQELLWSKIKAQREYQPTESTKWIEELSGSTPDQGEQELTEETATKLLELLSDSKRLGDWIKECDISDLSLYAESLLAPQVSD